MTRKYFIFNYGQTKALHLFHIKTIQFVSFNINKEGVLYLQHFVTDF